MNSIFDESSFLSNQDWLNHIETTDKSYDLIANHLRNPQNELNMHVLFLHMMQNYT